MRSGLVKEGERSELVFIIILEDHRLEEMRCGASFAWHKVAIFDIFQRHMKHSYYPQQHCGAL